MRVPRLRGLDNLHIWQKLALLGVVFALLFAIPTTLFLRQVATGLARSNQELRAIEDGTRLLELARALAEHRALAAAALAGDADATAARVAVQKRVDDGLAALAPQIRAARADTPLVAATEGWKALSAAVRDKHIAASESNGSHAEVIANTLAGLEMMVDSSGLTADPDAAVQHSVRIAFQHVPTLAEAIGRAEAQGMAFLATKQAAPEERTALAGVLARVKERQADVRAAVNKAMARSVDLQEMLAPRLLGSDAGVERSLKATRVDVVFNQDLAMKPMEHRAVQESGLDPQYKLAAAASTEARKMLQERAKRERAEIVAFVLAALGVFALAIWFGLWTARSITRPLGHAVKVADGIAAGHLDHAIDERRAKNAEAARLLAAFHSMQGALSGLMREIQLASGEIRQASAQVAEGNADLSARTEHQASSLEETAATMEQLSVAVKSNAESARKATSVVAQASESAMKGSESVASAVSSMQSVNEKSKRIVDIISVIDGIAFQTNILALNAAVEAARAGEQGRGFAVVAAEVRSLAQRSAQAAKEIKTLIGEAVEATRVGTRRVDESGRAMDEIMDSVQRVAAIFDEILSASDEQKNGIEQVERAVTQMDRATQENAALVGEVAASAQSLEQQAERLAELVARFRLRGEAAPAPPRVHAAAADPWAEPEPHPAPVVTGRAHVPRLTAAE